LGKGSGSDERNPQQGWAMAKSASMWKGNQFILKGRPDDDAPRTGSYGFPGKEKGGTAGIVVGSPEEKSLHILPWVRGKVSEEGGSVFGAKDKGETGGQRLRPIRLRAFTGKKQPKKGEKTRGRRQTK